MIRNFILYTLLSASFLLALTDSDFDGVSDIYDKCPNTPIELAVGRDGCSSKAMDITLMLGLEESVGKYGGTENISNSTTIFYAGFRKANTVYALSSSQDNTADTANSVNGQGDLYGTLSYYIPSKTRLQTALNAIIKFATASTDIGTGENDYGMKYNATLTNGKRSVMASIGYMLTGDTDSVTYNDVVSMSIGTGLQASSKLYLSASYYFASEYTEGSDNSSTVSLFGSYQINKRWFTTTSFSLGLSDAVPDSSFNLSAGVNF